MERFPEHPPCRGRETACTSPSPGQSWRAPRRGLWWGPRPGRSCVCWPGGGHTAESKGRLCGSHLSTCPRATCGGLQSSPHCVPTLRAHWSSLVPRASPALSSAGLHNRPGLSQGRGASLRAASQALDSCPLPWPCPFARFCSMACSSESLPLLFEASPGTGCQLAL